MLETPRRQFLAATMAAAASAWAGRISSASNGPDDDLIDAGAQSDFQGTAVSEKLAKSKKILIVRDGQRLIAVCAVCTHKACGVKPHGGELRCPCHGSTFSTIGAVKKGPAREPLAHLGIRLGADGHVLIDPGQRFAQDEWNDPQSFIAIK